MPRQTFPFLALLLILTACTQDPAPVEYRGSYYFGQDGVMGNNGMEAPKYSNNRRAQMPAQQETKYVSPVHDYGVAAEINDVKASDLPPPAALQLSPAPNAPEAAPPITQVQNVTPIAPPASDATINAPVDYYAQEQAQNSTGAHQFIWPVRGEVLSGFDASNKGITIRAMKGDPVRASDDGRVSAVGPQGALGMVITVTHAGQWESKYGYLGDSVVRIGDEVVRGQLVGFVAPAIGTTGAKVYFSLSHQGQAADPRALLVND